MHPGNTVGEPGTIVTDRLELVPATPSLLRAALGSGGRLASSLQAAVPPSWPHQYLDEQALQYVLDRLREGPEQDGWWLYFMVLVGGPEERTLIGSAGYKGPPTPLGTVEIGYGIVADRQRRGYATEAVRALVAHAFARPDVARVIAETLPELIPSIGVLRKCGFADAGEGSEPGLLRFELDRAPLL